MANGSKSAKGGAKAAILKFGAAAGEQLRDPHTRQQIVNQGLAIAEKAQQWRKERSQARAESGSEEHGRGDAVGFLAGRFGQQKLERRVDHLKRSIVDLRAARPELTEALAPAFTTLGQIDSALAIAEGLPFAKRKRAHLQIDGTLDDLETTIFDAAMPK